MITCPFCGPRQMEEYVFHKTTPGIAQNAIARVYERNSRERDSTEYWQHTRGCRAWLFVRRDPSSGQMLEVRMLRNTVR